MPPNLGVHGGDVSKIRVLITCKEAGAGDISRAFECDSAFAASCDEVLVAGEQPFVMTVKTRALLKPVDASPVYELIGERKDQGLARNFETVFNNVWWVQVLCLVLFGIFIVLPVVLLTLIAFDRQLPAAAGFALYHLDAVLFALVVLHLTDLYIHLREGNYLRFYLTIAVMVGIAALAYQMNRHVLPDDPPDWPGGFASLAASLLEQGQAMAVGAAPLVAIVSTLVSYKGLGALSKLLGLAGKAGRGDA